MSLLHLAGGGSSADDKLYVEDVFSTYLYTGNGSTQAINNGIDLAGKGGLVWIKERSTAASHYLFDTVQGKRKWLMTDLTNSASTTYSDSYDFDSFNSNGFSLLGGWSTNINISNHTTTSWTFRKAPKFFDCVTFVAGSNSNRRVSHSLGSTPGMIVLKMTTGTSNWIVYHRSLGKDYRIKLNLTDAQENLGNVWGTAEPTASDFGINEPGYLAPGQTYVAYLFAHDTSADGIIQCGSYVGNGSTTGPIANLGWEPQYILLKPNSAIDWQVFDSSRGMPATSGAAAPTIMPNLSVAEDVGGSGLQPTATGFKVTSNSGRVNGSGTTYLYLAIRRPMKVPTSGTEVYNAIARTGTGAAVTVTGVGFAPDVLIGGIRNGASQTYINFRDRLRGPTAYLYSSQTSAEASDAASVVSMDMDGFSHGASGGTNSLNTNYATYINHFFKRAKGFFDIVCYTGTGVAKTEAHNLGVVPELMIVKNRSAVSNWIVNYGHTKNSVFLNLTNSYIATSAYWNSTLPTSSVFTVGTDVMVNASPNTYVAYLFATLAGVSKVGSYTGNGTTQTINCGFTTGARFVLCKRVDSTGDWVVMDSVRGLVSGADATLALNSTAAEVSVDCIDPSLVGFEVVQEATRNLNVNGGQYVFLAIA